MKPVADVRRCRRRRRLRRLAAAAAAETFAACSVLTVWEWVIITHTGGTHTRTHLLVVVSRENTRT